MNPQFWAFFDSEAAPKLALREKTFRRIFEHLDSVDGSLTILETGCARLPGNWAGDGQSTLMFDKYVSCRDLESTCHTVDINPTSVAECRKLVSGRVNVIQDDSVHFLIGHGKTLKEAGKRVHLLYLDSFDLDATHWYPSAIHHLKELTAAMRFIDEKTLVVVDDCPLTGNFVPSDGNQVSFLGGVSVGGKGRLVAEFAVQAGAKVLFAEYQAGWTGF